MGLRMGSGFTGPFGVWVRSGGTNLKGFKVVCGFCLGVRGFEAQSTADALNPASL